MAIGFDTYDSGGLWSTASPKTWSHSSTTAINDGVVVFMFTLSHTTEVTGVTFGGTAMALVASQIDTAGGGHARVEAWFLSNPPTGTKTVSVAYTGTTLKSGCSISFTADTVDTAVEVFATAGGQSADPQLATDSGAVEVMRIIGLWSGHNNPSALTALTGQTSRHAQDMGTKTALVDTETSVSTGSKTYGWTAASAQWAIVHLAITEVATDVTITPSPALIALVAPSVGLTVPVNLTPTPALIALVAPSVTVDSGGLVTLTPSPAALTLVPPSVALTVPVNLTPDVAALTLVAPSVALTVPVDIAPAPALLALVAPSIALTVPVNLTPTPALVALVAPSVALDVPVNITPDVAALTLVAPSVTLITGVVIEPDAALIALLAPSVSLTVPVTLLPSATDLALAPPSIAITLGAPEPKQTSAAQARAFGPAALTAGAVVPEAVTTGAGF